MPSGRGRADVSESKLRAMVAPYARLGVRQLVPAIRPIASGEADAAVLNGAPDDVVARVETGRCGMIVGVAVDELRRRGRAILLVLLAEADTSTRPRTFFVANRIRAVVYFHVPARHEWAIQDRTPGCRGNAVQALEVVDRRDRKRAAMEVAGPCTIPRRKCSWSATWMAREPIVERRRRLPADEGRRCRPPWPSARAAA